MINNISESIPLSINLKGRLLTLDSPIVMGILNVTTDSFYKKSRYTTHESLQDACEKMLAAGVSIIDIGAASSRPGAKLIEAKEETELLIPLLSSLVKAFPDANFSIDTYNASTAKVAVESGAALINDISAGVLDAQMFSTIASLKVPYIMMHMQGIPFTMQVEPHYENVLKETMEFFVQRVALARAAGISDLIIDPGFGFGKTLEHNYVLLKHLRLFELFQLPILCGVSRKSIINKVIHTKADSALNGTTVLNTIALLNGASIIRVHDVLEARQAVDLVHYYQNCSSQ